METFYKSKVLYNVDTINAQWMVRPMGASFVTGNHLLLVSE